MKQGYWESKHVWIRKQEFEDEEIKGICVCVFLSIGRKNIVTDILLRGVLLLASIELELWKWKYIT